MVFAILISGEFFIKKVFFIICQSLIMVGELGQLDCLDSRMSETSAHVNHVWDIDDVLNKALRYEV